MLIEVNSDGVAKEARMKILRQEYVPPKFVEFYLSQDTKSGIPFIPNESDGGFFSS